MVWTQYEWHFPAKDDENTEEEEEEENENENIDSHSVKQSNNPSENFENNLEPAKKEAPIDKKEKTTVDLEPWGLFHWCSVESDYHVILIVLLI